LPITTTFFLLTIGIFHKTSYYFTVIPSFHDPKSKQVYLTLCQGHPLSRKEHQALQKLSDAQQACVARALAQNKPHIYLKHHQQKNFRFAISEHKGIITQVCAKILHLTPSSHALKTAFVGSPPCILRQLQGMPEQKRLSLAFLLVSEYSELVAEHIELFNISADAPKIQLAQAIHNGSLLSQHIHKFHIQQESARAALAQQTLRVVIADIILDQETSVDFCIENFHINDPNLQLEIFKSQLRREDCLSKRQLSRIMIFLTGLLKRASLPMQQRLELVEHYLQEQAETVCLYLEHFDIKFNRSEGKRLIASIARSYPQLLVDNIRTCKLTSLPLILCVVDVFMRSSPDVNHRGNREKYLLRFAAETAPDIRFRIAMRMLKADPYHFPLYIKALRIPIASCRLLLLKKLLTSSHQIVLQHLLQHIADFDIKDAQERMQIAQQLLELQEEHTFRNLSHFQLKESDRISLATQALQKGSSSPLLFFSQLMPLEKHAHIDFVMLAARLCHRPLDFVRCFDHFNISDKEICHKILRILLQRPHSCWHKSPKIYTFRFADYIRTFQLEDAEELRTALALHYVRINPVRVHEQLTDLALQHLAPPLQLTCDLYEAIQDRYQLAKTELNYAAQRLFYQFLCDYTRACCDLTPEEGALVIAQFRQPLYQKLLQAHLNYHPAHACRFWSFYILQLALSTDREHAYLALTKQYHRHPLANLYLASLPHTVSAEHRLILTPLVDALARKLNAQKDAAKVNTFIQALHQLFSNTSLSEEEKILWLQTWDQIGNCGALQQHGTYISGHTYKSVEHVKHQQAVRTREEGFQDMLQWATYLTTLILMEQSLTMQEIPTLRQLQERVMTAGKVMLDLPAIPDFDQKFYQHILSLPHYEALFIYSRGLIKDRETATLNLLKLFIIDIMNQSYPQQRYATHSHPHLAQLERAHRVVYAQWQTNHSYPLSDVLQVGDSRTECRFSTFKFFYQKIIHFQHVDSEKLQVLIFYLHNQDPDLIDALATQEFRSEEETLQLKCMQLIQHSSLSINSQLLAFKEIIGIVEQLAATANKKWGLFLSDLQGVVKGLERMLRPTASYAGWTAVDTDDVWRLFYCPTEVGESCQSVIDTASHFNKCLLAYPMDGKNRLLAIMDANKKIKARAILRLLLTEDTQDPILFLETIYPSAVKPEWSMAIEWMAKKKASLLGIPVLVAHTCTTQEPISCISLGSCVEHEYVDAAQGPQDKGVFQIQGYLLE